MQPDLGGTTTNGMRQEVDIRAADTHAGINFLRDFFGEAALWPLVAIKKVGKKSASTGICSPNQASRNGRRMGRALEHPRLQHFAINRLNIWKTKACKDDVRTGCGSTLTRARVWTPPPNRPDSIKH